jgi:hypothetical protein
VDVRFASKATVSVIHHAIRREVAFALLAPRQGPRLMGVELWRTSKAHIMAARTIFATQPWFFEKGVRQERRLAAKGR